MTDTPRLWDRRADETPKSYAAFLAYVALGARRSVREAARQYHSNTTSTGEISSDEDTTVRPTIEPNPELPPVPQIGTQPKALHCSCGLVNPVIKARHRRFDEDKRAEKNRKPKGGRHGSFLGK